ncbi:MAG: FtsW/RodA/SpoVE family cell cycle protein [Gordonia sp. (in: high G+C Gram-positive bacteria)]|uniref:FtsW/RodA/SpoVE family cell cycle protein n=1 Tax=Gordonia sp. (in: high G+C Gram-positive bacteria) TaxID=84139 RepID=UPI0039E299C0
MTVTPAAQQAPQAAPKAPGRTTETVLIVAALVVVTGALIIVQMAQSKDVTWGIAKYVAVYAALMLAAHLMIRRFAPHADPLMLPAVAALNGLGLVMIHRLFLGGDGATGLCTPQSADRQLIWTGLGVAAFAVTLFFIRDHKTLSRYAYTLGIGGLIFLALPAVLPASLSSEGGSKIWIKTPLFSIQPGEFAKILIIIFTASFLVSRRDLFTTAGKHFAGMDLPRLRDLGPLIAAWAIALAVLVFETDLGTSLLIFATALTMLYVATERVSWLLLGVIGFVIAAVFAYLTSAHLQERVQAWLDPFAAWETGSQQLGQSLFGLATGGLFGTGLGSGRPNMVPCADTDFILTSFGEELGLFGLTAITVLYLVLIIRGLRTAVTVRDSFGKLLAAGLAFTIAIQLFVVFGGVSKLIPLTGLTSPFLSYGGSSLLANYILLALLIRISNAAREPDAPKPVRRPEGVGGMPTQVVPRQ